VILLAVVALISGAIGVSLIWVEASVVSVRRAERSFVIEESLISAVRLAAYEGTVSQATDCAELGVQRFVMNAIEIEVTCEQSSVGLHLTAQALQRSVRASVTKVSGSGARWKLQHWEWLGAD
jgi:hypothetical protein